jgi:hypothetical protein
MNPSSQPFFPRFPMAVAALLVAGGACGGAVESSPADVHSAFLENLAEACGQAFAGEVIRAPEEDPYFQAGAELVLHIRECSPDEVRIPVFMGDDRSRTWIFTRTGGGIDLRHDHRHPDGRPEPNTFYGAFVSEEPIATVDPTPNRHEFKRIREDGMVLGWVVEILPGERYTYGTQRDGQWRHRFDFDLTTPVTPPPDPWGHPPVGETPALAPAQEEFLGNLARHCGNAYHGTITLRPDTDQLFEGDETLTVHFRECGDNRMMLPFHVEENRSRTWILTRTTAGIDLRHDHRHEDGSPESNTWYGAHTPDEGSPTRQEFLREEPRNGATTGWAIEIIPDERYTYGTIRNGEWVYRLDFDLTTQAAQPPAPWGH